MIKLQYKPSQEARFSTLSLEECKNDSSMQNTRINEYHGLLALSERLEAKWPTYNFVIECDMKLKKSAIMIKKSPIKGYDLLIKIASLQVSYKTLDEALLLADKVVEVYDSEKGTLFKFPTGDNEKGVSTKFVELAKQYAIGRYDGFDKTIATGANHVCTSCSYSFGAINTPNPDKPYDCPKCKAPMLSDRINYNYRKDNIGKHWGTLSQEELLKEIDIRSVAFSLLSKAQQDKALELQGLTRSDVPEHLKNKSQDDTVLNVEVESKVSIYDDLLFGPLLKLCKERGIKRERKDNRFSLIEKLKNYDKENSNE